MTDPHVDVQDRSCSVHSLKTNELEKKWYLIIGVHTCSEKMPPEKKNPNTWGVKVPKVSDDWLSCLSAWFKVTRVLAVNDYLIMCARVFLIMCFRPFAIVKFNSEWQQNKLASIPPHGRHCDTVSQAFYKVQFNITVLSANQNTITVSKLSLHFNIVGGKNA